LGGMSSCGTDWPTSVYWPGVFSLIAFSSSAVHTLLSLPSETILAYLTFLPVLVWMTWLLLARHSLAGTPIIAAPASINVMRPAAPARLIASKFMRTLHEPPVISAARTGSLYLGSLSTSWMF